MPLTPTALNFALLLSTGLRIPENWLTDAGPAIQRAIAEAETLPLATRLAAAEHAASMGAFKPLEVGELYRRIVFTKEELDDAIAIAEDKGGAWGRALLHQASRQQQTSLERSSFWLPLWQNSLDTRNAMLAALVNEEALLTSAESLEQVQPFLDAWAQVCLAVGLGPSPTRSTTAAAAGHDALAKLGTSTQALGGVWEPPAAPPPKRKLKQ